MKIGFYIKWPKGSLNSGGNVLGDELFAKSMCRTLLRMSEIESCELYALNYQPRQKLDAMIYLNDTKPNSNWAAKHILYLQNAYGEGSDKALARFQQMGYDGYAFVSNKLLKIHEKQGFSGIFLPFGVDTELFNSKEKDKKYSYDVSYIGNDIKGEMRTLSYLYPAINFNFGLYGTWKLPYKFKFWKNKLYQRKFSKITRGKIKQEDVPLLYISSKINLNCTAQDCVDWDVITLRTFEVLACKGFLISDRVAIAEQELHDCVVFTDGGLDLKEKIQYYLKRPKERERIAQNGYEYIIKNATVASRMNCLVAYLKKIL